VKWCELNATEVFCFRTATFRIAATFRVCAATSLIAEPVSSKCILDRVEVVVCRGGNLGLWPFWDVANASENARLSGKTGIERRVVKVTRVTQTGHFLTRQASGAEES
jgi:hypothetical protein